jgi:hypothetical protein
MKIITLMGAIVGLLTVTPALAQGPEFYERQRAINALNDSARAQDRQADSLRRLKRIEHDRALREDRQSRIDNRDSRDRYREEQRRR